jgi:hypothetical protein
MKTWICFFAAPVLIHGAVVVEDQSHSADELVRGTAKIATSTTDSHEVVHPNQ